MPRRYKPGDLITMKVLAVATGHMRVEFDGSQFEIQMPHKPMSRKELRGSIQHITKRWQEIMGKPIAVQPHVVRRYPMKQWQEDRKRLEEEGF